MCLPLKCLKAFALFQGVIALLLAISAFICAYYVKTLMDKINNSLGELGLLMSFITSRYITTPFFMLAFCILIIAICAFLGTLLKQKKFFLVILNLGNLCFLLTFSLIGIIAIAIGNNITENNTCQPSDPQYTNIQSMYAKASKNLCKSTCECYYAKEITPIIQKEVLVYNDTDTSYAINAQQCEYFQSQDLLEANAIQWMEEKFDCSGWCTEYSIKMFHDVNSGVKDQFYSCYQAVGNYFKSIFTISGKVFIIFGIFMGVMFILTCCLGCHPENQHQFDNYKKVVNIKQ